MLRGIVRWEIFTGLELSRALFRIGFSTGEIYHGENFHEINSQERIFCGSKFLLGGQVIYGKTFPQRKGFWSDLKIIFSNESAIRQIFTWNCLQKKFRGEFSAGMKMSVRSFPGEGRRN